MKKAGKPSSNAAQGIASRLGAGAGAGIRYSNEDLWKDEPEAAQPAQPAKPATAEEPASTPATQRRRQRKNKS